MASIRKRPTGQWGARYRDREGKEHARHVDRKSDAQRWLDQVTSDLVRGTYVDPKADQLRFGAFAEEWLAEQTLDVSGRVRSSFGAAHAARAHCRAAAHA